MKKLSDLKKVLSNLEPEGQGRGIIMGVTRLILLGQFYTIQNNFMYFFAHDCRSITRIIVNEKDTIELLITKDKDKRKDQTY